MRTCRPNIYQVWSTLSFSRADLHHCGSLNLDPCHDWSSDPDPSYSRIQDPDPCHRFGSAIVNGKMAFSNEVSIDSKLLIRRLCQKAPKRSVQMRSPLKPSPPVALITCGAHVACTRRLSMRMAMGRHMCRRGEPDRVRGRDCERCAPRIEHSVARRAGGVVNRDGAAPPFLCCSLALVKLRIVSYKTVDLIAIQYAIVASHVQNLVAAVDAFQVRVIWEPYAMPAI